MDTDGASRGPSTPTRIDMVGFLGAGRMATALARAWIDARLLRADALTASDPVPAARQAFADATHSPAGADNKAVVRASAVVILAVKPQTLPALLQEVYSEIA